MRGRAAGVLGAAVAAALVLGGCTAGAQPRVVDGSTVTVAVTEPFTSRNADTGYGATQVNADVAYLTGSGFGYYDDRYRLVLDDSFGRAEIVDDSPFTVDYTIADGTRWSDGVGVSAADLLVSWAGNSRALNDADFDPEPFVDPETGRFTDEFPSDVVWFDGADGVGLDESKTARVLQGGRTLQVVFDHYFPEWPLAVQPELPAHVLGSLALGEDDAEQAADEVVDAISAGGVDLAAVSRAWNDAWNLTAMPDDAELLVASGPYLIDAIDEQSVTLRANPEYRGDRQPTIERIVLRTVPDPMEAIALLRAGEVDVASPAPSAAVVGALDGLDGVSVQRGAEGKIEHLELQLAGSKTGIFGDARVREAFLRTVPRAALVEQLIQPLDEDAEVVDSFVFRPGAEGYTASVDDNGSASWGTADPERAERELTEAAPASREVCILFDPANPRRVAEFEAIKAAAALGAFVVTDCSSPDWRELLGVPGSYDAALFAWDTTHLGTTAVEAVYGSPPAASNYTGFSDGRVDDLIAELGIEQDPDARETIARELDAQIWRSAWGLPLFAFPTITAVRDGLLGVTRSPLEHGVFWNAWDWRPDPDAAEETPAE